MTIYKNLNFLTRLLSDPRDFVCPSLEDNSLEQAFRENLPEEDVSYFEDGDYMARLKKLIEKDYLYLFVGVSKPLASPYASMYYGKKPSNMGPPARKIAQIMKKWGIEIAGEYRDMPDHYVLMISLLSILGQHREEVKEQVLKEEISKDIRIICQELSFLPRLKERVKKEEKIEYYSWLIGLADKLIKEIK